MFLGMASVFVTLRWLGDRTVLKSFSTGDTGNVGYVSLTCAGFQSSFLLREQYLPYFFESVTHSEIVQF